MEFTTEVKDVDIYGLGTDADEIYPSTMTVKWTAELEVREWGIKMISIYPNSVTGSIELEENRYEEKDTFEKEIAIDSKNSEWELQCEGTDGLNLSDSIMPDNVSINFEDKTITVSF